MDFVGRARESLTRCEQELSKLIAEAAAVGDYEAASFIARLARGVANRPALISDGDSDPAGTGGNAVSESDRPPASTVGDRVTGQAPMVNGKGWGARTGRTEPEELADGYPKFRRDGDKLIKLGWSRAAGERYEHRAGKTVLELVAKAALSATDSRQRFETGALGNLRLGKGQPPIPSYQVYLCLAWLRASGLIKPLGRSAYRIASKAGFVEQLEEKWDQTEQI